MSAILVTPRRRCRWLNVLAFVLVSVASSVARADDAPSNGMTVRVDYRAPATCPSRSEFLDKVRAYTTRWSLVDAGAAERAFVVVIDGAKGTLEITTGSRKTRRVVPGPNCQDAARALAVMVALVIDPNASTTAGGQEAAPPPAAPSPPPSTESSAAPQGEPIRPRGRRPITEGVRARPAEPWFRFSFELREEVTRAVIDRSLMVIGGFVDGEVRLITAPDEKKNSLASIFGRPSIGVGVRQSLPRSIGVPGGSTEFLWSVATVRVCPLRFRLVDSNFVVAPCVEGSAGALRAESEGIPLAQATSKRWFDGSASLLGVWQLGGPWIATASVALVVPLARYRFEVVELRSRPPRSELVSQAPALGMAFGLGLGLRL